MLCSNQIVFITFCVVISNAATPETESCYSYAGGSVYPSLSNPEKADHKLQWTKAVSKYFIFLH